EERRGWGGPVPPRPGGFFSPLAGRLRGPPCFPPPPPRRHRGGREWGRRRLPAPAETRRSRHGRVEVAGPSPCRTPWPAGVHPGNAALRRRNLLLRGPPAGGGRRRRIRTDPPLAGARGAGRRLPQLPCLSPS